MICTRELHATANGDGTYTVQIVGQFPDGLKSFIHPHAYIKMDGTVDQLPGMQSIHFQVGDQQIQEEAFRQFVDQIRS